MKSDEFMQILSDVPGVLDIRSLDRGLIQRVVDHEVGLRHVSGGMRLENPGVGTCASCDNVMALFCDVSFPRPTTITMEMVDDRGVTVGHDVPDPMRSAFIGRDDIIWVSDNFILYRERFAPYDVSMVLSASRLEYAFPEGIEAWSFYPSPGAADMLNDELGMHVPGMATILIGVDGLESVPVADVMQVPCTCGGHGEPASEDALDRCDLV